MCKSLYICGFLSRFMWVCLCIDKSMHVYVYVWMGCTCMPMCVYVWLNVGVGSFRSWRSKNRYGSLVHTV